MIHVNNMNNLVRKTSSLGKNRLTLINLCRYNGNQRSKHNINIPMSNSNIISYITSWSNNHQHDKTEKNDNVYTLDFISVPSHKFSTTSSSSGSSNTLKHNDMDDIGANKEKDINTISDNVTAAAERRRELTKKGMTHAKEGMSKVKLLMAKYGYFFVGTYLSVYFGTWSTLYFLLDNGLVDPSSLSIPNWFPFSHSSEEDATLVSLIADLADNFEVTKKYVESIKKKPEFVNLGIAWVATKFTEPIRLGVSIFLTPKIARLFGRKEKDFKDDE